MRSARAAAGLLAAVLTTLGAGLVGPGAAPAYAAGCSTVAGVTVVVDYNELGDGLQAGCVAGGGGGRASSLFPDAGFPLAYAQRSPGFVCRVSGVPAADPCTDAAPADQHWSLWWSDGKSGRWTYATLGVSGLRVPDGGYLAFAWHQGAGRAVAPDVAPTPRTTPSAQPTAKPSAKPSVKPVKPTVKPPVKSAGKPSGQASAGPGRPAPSGAATDASAPAVSATPDPKEPSASGSPSATETASAAPGAAPSGAPSPLVSGAAVPGIDEVTDGPPQDGVAESADTPEQDGGVPAWLAVVVVAGVVGAGAVVAVRRRNAA